MSGSGEAPASIRVALFTGNYNHIVDGVSLTLNRLVRHLEARGHQVLVLGPGVGRPALAHAGTFVPVPSIPAPGRPEYRASLYLPRAARARVVAFAPHLYHIATPDLLGQRSLRLGRARGIPVVASYHTHFSAYLGYYGAARLEGLLWRYLRWFYGRAAHVYVPSDSIRESLEARGVRAEFRLWERGVDTELYAPGRRSLEWRRSLGIGDPEVVMLFASRLVREKGLETWARVSEGLTRRGLAHQALVVGDGPERRALEGRLPRARFTGELTGESLARAYASSDLFVFPSHTETFGSVTLEAMASGLACVCADAPGSRSLVVPGETGFLARPGDAADFEAQVARLVEGPELRLGMGARGRARAGRYEWGATLDRLLCHYREVLGEPGLAGPGAGGP